MRAFLRTVASLTWALWFGGVIALFLSVTTLFRNDRAIAVVAAPQLFHAFEKYQLLLALVVLLATFFWWLVAPFRHVIAIFILLAMPTVAAVVETTAISPRIDALQLRGETHTPQFRQLHGLSMSVYLAEAASLLAAGGMICIAPELTGVRSTADCAYPERP